MLDHRNVDYQMFLRRYDVELENLELPENIITKMLPTNPLLRDVARAVTNIRFREVTPAVIRAIQMKIPPLQIINEGLTCGMEIVSTLYSKRIYHLPEIMMASKIMEIGISLAEITPHPAAKLVEFGKPETIRVFHRDGEREKKRSFPQSVHSGVWKSQPLALILELMSRTVAAMSGLIFIRSSILRMEESTVA